MSHSLTNPDVLGTSPKGWRQRRVGEIIQKGDIRPCRGIDWEFVPDDDTGQIVLGKRDTPTDEIEMIMTPRKRLHPRAIDLLKTL